LAASPQFGQIGSGIAQGMQAAAAKSQAGTAKRVRGLQGDLFREQTRQAGAQADLHEQTAIGVGFRNIIAAEEARWGQTEAGKTAIHGRMIGGGPVGTGVATALDMALESLKGPQAKTGPIEIYPTKATQKKLDRSRAQRNR